MDEAVETVAELVRKAGGRALLVGGCIRDGLLGGDPKDFDVESESDLRNTIGKRELRRAIGRRKNRARSG